MHAAEHIILGAFKPDIDRVAREPERGSRRRLEPGKLGLVFEMAPEERSQEIGQSEVEGRGGDRSGRQAPVNLFRRHFGDSGARLAERQCGRRFEVHP